MRKANIFMHDIFAGILEEKEPGGMYEFTYDDKYNGPPISLTMPVEKKFFIFMGFPKFFEGLLPEGIMLEGLLRQNKIDKYDYFSQLTSTGNEMIGAITVKEVK